MDTPQERAYRSAFRRVESLQMELRRNYSVRRREEAQRKLEEALPALETARRDLIKLRNHQRKGDRKGEVPLPPSPAAPPAAPAAIAPAE